MTLPNGFRVQLARGILTADSGRLLVGGSPLTAMRLTSRAQAMLVGGEVTVTDAASAHLADRLLATNLGVPDLCRLPTVAEHDLTVVIPVRDRPDQLDRTLGALRPLRCVVVDDASLEPEPVAEVTRRHGADLIELPVNVGPASRTQRGTRHRHHAVRRLRRLRRGSGRCRPDPTGPALRRPSGEPGRTARHWCRPIRAPRLVREVRRGRLLPHPRDEPRQRAARRDGRLASQRLPGRPGGSARQVGSIPSLRVGEDVDLVWRLHDAGHRVRYDPTSEARHDTRPTMKGWLGRKYVYGSGGAALAARHGNKLAPAVLTPSYAVAAAALLLRDRRAFPIAAIALASGAWSVRTALPESAGREAIAVRLAARGLLWAVRQESALLLRHWWPAALCGALASRRIGRAVAAAVAVDAVVAVLEQREQRDSQPRPALATIFAGRRLDDLAYGAGLWWGAVRAGSPRALLPRRPSSS